MSAEFSSGIRLSPGDTIGAYRILEVFDPGAFTFPARAVTQAGRQVFLKKYRRPGGNSPWYDGYVAYQKQLKSRIESNPVAKTFCYDFVEFFEKTKSSASGLPLRAFYQVFEWMEGGMSLRQALDELRTNPAALQAAQKIIFARVMMAAINSLHAAGIVHTDLKPENLYLQKDPSIAAKYRLRVIDLDFSILSAQRAPWDGQEGYIGTPNYMSPEHLNNTVPGPQSDIFTAGLILGELLGGCHPAGERLLNYDERAIRGTLQKIRLPQHLNGVDDRHRLEEVLNAMLDPNPSVRPNAERVLMALNGRFTAEGPARVPPPAAVSPFLGTGNLTAPGPPPKLDALHPKGGRLSIKGPNRKSLTVSISGVFGKRNFGGWGEDFERFMSPEQFQLERNDNGRWSIKHCPGARNATKVNGAILDRQIVITGPVKVALGESERCAIEIAHLPDG